jgi:hypothetical protein
LEIEYNERGRNINLHQIENILVIDKVSVVTKEVEVFGKEIDSLRIAEHEHGK